ncbi:MAG: dihydropteroate synthase [Rhodobacteraceae bacterium]|nr:dihydropteroate synthase [Paracoccaceae bacterium]
MKRYFRPILVTDSARPSGAHILAGGWCWFERVEVLARGEASKIIAADDLPKADLRRLTRPRAPVAGLDMDEPRLMGILNLTPDSFSDGGRFNTPDAAPARAKAMVAAGADILDIGGESTRPGADPVPSVDELARTIPVIKAMRAQGMETPISFDTRKADVAVAGINAGVDLINDVSALSYDDAMTGIVADASIPVCVMHARGQPKTMMAATQYSDVLLDVYDYLEEKLNEAEAGGINRDRVILDPGIGFAKGLEENLTILNRLSLFHSLGCILLLGASRKRFIGTISGEKEASARLPGSLAVALAALSQGVQIIRVHDIAETRQAIDLNTAISKGGWKP